MPSKIRVAVTVDDLPSHGDRPKGVSRLDVHTSLLATFAAHEIEAYGFINGARAADGDDERASLKAWVEAKQPLANHTASHPRLVDIGLAAYLADIDANEAVLASLLVDPQIWHYFRYPYLYEGNDRATTTAVRQHLTKGHYRIAEVTIDFFDWAFNGPYARCHTLGDDKAIVALRQTYLGHALAMLRWSEAAGREIYGRSIPHVLLLHVGAFDAVMMDDLLDAYEAEGVEWITLAEALADPIYGDLPIADGVTQGTLLDAMIDIRGAAHPPQPMQPHALLSAMCPIPGDDGKPSP